ncbi:MULTISPECIES: AfsA-related hotdog domain-containing protein [Streptomyces]|uniref:AfsA-related hotdog domain-containing protein n=1 Tax=Streptomyces TaxID=1883 RepID=UPI0029A4CA0E|nr:AfsA-related hotdog domain-containing protein [Streptomyces sp. WI03-4A]MDX2591371.1 AfsA-related hotdog domain-containing protein [Streptomyces sp. WI03-4A]
MQITRQITRPAHRVPGREATAAPSWPSYTPDKLGLNTTTTVDRRYAHKESGEDVFINDVARHPGTGMLTAVGTLPRAHRYFSDSVIDRYDALHLAEFMRQGVEVIAHTLLGVPLTHQFVLRTVDLRISEPAAAVSAEHAVIVFSEELVRRNGSSVPYAAAGPVHCVVDGRPLARCDGLVGFLAPETYSAMRGEDGRRRPEAPVGRVVPERPQRVGRRFPENVFIGQVTGPVREASCLLLPQTPPTFFDRPLDHYPGMMIAEGARQLAVLSFAEATGTPVDRVHTQDTALDFTSFAELDTPPALRIVSWVASETAGAGDAGAEITVVARQGARTTSTCTFRMSTCTENPSEGRLP